MANGHIEITVGKKYFKRPANLEGNGYGPPIAPDTQAQPGNWKWYKFHALTEGDIHPYTQLGAWYNFSQFDCSPMGPFEYPELHQYAIYQSDSFPFGWMPFTTFQLEFGGGFEWDGMWWGSVAANGQPVWTQTPPGVPPPPPPPPPPGDDDDIWTH